MSDEQEHLKNALLRIAQDTGALPDTDHWVNKAVEEGHANFTEEEEFELKYPENARALFTPIELGHCYQVRNLSGSRNVDVKTGNIVGGYPGEEEYRTERVLLDETVHVTVDKISIEEGQVVLQGKVEAAGAYTGPFGSE